MDPNSVKRLYSVIWTQPYATSLVRPRLRDQLSERERAIESYLTESTNYPDAVELIKRIKQK